MTNYTVMLKNGERKLVKDVDYVFLDQLIIRFLDSHGREIETFALMNISVVTKRV